MAFQQIEELVNLRNLALYYYQLSLAMPPYLGSTYFPDIKINDDLFSYLTQRQVTPTLAKASTYDATPLPTNRSTFEQETFSTQFFRTEKTRNEKDIMDLNTALQNADPQFLDTAIANIFDDQSQMLNDHKARREWLAMQALCNGYININSNGVRTNITYLNDPDFQMDAGDDWTDTTGSDIYTDIQNVLKTMRAKGVYPNQMLMSENTFRLIQRNVKLKSTSLNPNFEANTGMWLTASVIDFIRAEFRIQPVIYSGVYADEETGAFMPFVPDGKVIFFNAPLPSSDYAWPGSLNSPAPLVNGTQALGHMAFAPTPEEVGVKMGKINASNVQMFDTGVAFHEWYNDRAVQQTDLVSMNVLPSFEGSRTVFRLNVAPGKNTQDPTGKAPDPYASEDSPSSGANSGATSSGSNPTSSASNNSGTSNAPKA